MKLYDKVYYELDPFFPSFCQRLTSGEKMGVHSGPGIFMTIEEAKEIWDAAQDRACALQMGEPGDTKIFEAFLQSKGINI